MPLGARMWLATLLITGVVMDSTRRAAAGASWNQRCAQRGVCIVANYVLSGVRCRMGEESHDERRQGAELLAFYSKEPMKTSGKAPRVRQLPVSAIAGYEFDGGPAQERMVYVTHPRKAHRLIPFAKFDALVSEDKPNEALRIMHDLGASKITSTKSVETKSRADVRLPLGKAFGGGKASHESQHVTSYSHEGSGSKPRDPAPLLWPNEPGFEAARRAVLFGGSRKITIEVNGATAFEVDGEMGIKLRKAGFTLGASAKRGRITRFKIVAEFPDPAAFDASAGSATQPTRATGEEGSGQPRRRWGV